MKTKQFKSELKDLEVYDHPINQRETIKKIISIRKEKGVTQNQIAEYLEVSRSYYSGMENLKNNVSEPYIRKIAEFFNMEYFDLVIYEKDYSSGYYDCLADYSHYLFDNMYYILFGLNKKTDGYYSSSLYLFLQEMDYTITIETATKAYEDIINEKTYPSDCESNKGEYFVEEETIINNNILKHIFSSDVKNNCIFKVSKGKGTVFYWSIEDFFRYEKIIKSSIQGYIDTIASDYSRLFKSKNNIKEENDDSKVIDDEESKIKTMKYKIKQIKYLINQIEETISEYEESRTDENK